MNEPSGATEEDVAWMRLALRLAARGEGWVEPNPMVGCVLVADGQVIGEGFHQRFGGPHAEVEAINDARQRGHADLLPRATAFVTLEPCCHYGKTPPCTQALIASRIRRVVVAALDPYPEVAGKGVEQLRQAGIATEVGVLAEEARQLNAPYWKRVLRGMPWVIAKWAMSLDGKIATRTGASQWISSAESRQRVHQLRARVDAIVVGSRTARVDDPMLTARRLPVVPRVARRVVVDSQASLPLDSKLAHTARDVPVLLWSSPDADPQRVAALKAKGVEVQQYDNTDRGEWLRELCRFLTRQYQATNVLVEGGGQLLGSLFDHDLVDEIHCYIGPLVIGGTEAPGPVAGVGVAVLQQATNWQLTALDRSGDDVFIQARRAESAVDQHENS